MDALPLGISTRQTCGRDLVHSGVVCSFWANIRSKIRSAHNRLVRKLHERARELGDVSVTETFVVLSYLWRYC